MRTFFPAADRRRVVWGWRVAGTQGRCRLLWKLDEVGARIWAESHDLDLERIDGSNEVRTGGPPGISMRGRAFQRLGRPAPAQVRRFPRR